MPFDGLYKPEDFSEDIAKTLATYGDSMESVLNLGRLVQQFISENNTKSFWDIGEPATISSGLPGRRLLDGPGNAYRVLLAQYGANMATAVHSHEGWVVIGIIEGSERYQSWRRADDGSDPKHAKLELAQDHHIMPGEFGYLYNEPYNVHRQSAEADGALEIVLMKGRGRRLEHIDEVTGECSQPIELNR